MQFCQMSKQFHFLQQIKAAQKTKDKNESAFRESMVASSLFHEIDIIILNKIKDIKSLAIKNIFHNWIILLNACNLAYDVL